MIEPRASIRKAFGDTVRNNLASIVAVLVSVVSLGVALSSNRTQERMLAANVWPALEFETGNRSDDGSAEITLVLRNNGVGPARLRGVRVMHEGAFVADSRRLMQHCCAPGDSPANDVTAGTRGRVLKAGDQVVLVMLPRATNDEALWKRFDRARFDVTLRACYCSVLDDCWIFDSTKMDPEPVRSCPVLAAEEEWSG